MERKVIFRDRQEYQAADASNMQDFTDESLQSILKNAISKENKIAGMLVTAKSATEITVAAGKLLIGSAGKIYSLDSSQDISLFSYLPVIDKKYISVCAFGVEEDIDIQARDFIIDLQTEVTEPREVAMEQKRAVTLYIIAGTESSDPQKPSIPTGYTKRADILLTTSGIDTIVMNTDVDLPNLNEVNSDVSSLKQWRSATEPIISTLSTDVSALASRLSSIKDHNQAVRELASDIARLKEISNLPDSYSSYGADYFLNDDESDIQNANYDAKTEEGIRFPDAASDNNALSLFNQYEPQVYKSEQDGFIMPTFEHNKRISLTGYAGEIAISQYQSQSHNFNKSKMGRERQKYGPLRILSSSALHWRTGAFDHLNTLVFNGEIFSPSPDDLTFFYRKPGLHIDKIIPPYFEQIANQTTIIGSQIAQTFLSSQHGYLTKIGLHFTKKDTDGLVYIHICETKNGVPDLSKTLAEASLSPSLLKIYPEETSFVLPKPVFLKAGKRYALVITTTGDHRVAVVSGSVYLQGTLFYSSDGEYYAGDLTKDLMVNLYFAKFNASFAQVNLTPISLSGGIADLNLLASVIKPESTEFFLEYQYNSKWWPLSPDTADNLKSLPALLPLRAVFVGSEDVMPAIELSNSQLSYSRPKTSFKHISIERTLPAPKTDIEVSVLLENYDDAKHGCSLKLLVGQNEVSPGSVIDTEIASKTIRRKAAFSFDPAISAYKVIVEGTTNDASDVFVVSERIDVAL